MANGHQPSPQARPTPAGDSNPDGAENAPSKRDLASWWKTFKKTSSKKDEDKGLPPVPDNKSKHLLHWILWIVRIRETNIEPPAPPPSPQGIFGVPLQTSVKYANVAISLYDADGNSFTYGYVPILVAKCGVFLKEKGELNTYR